MWIKTAKNDKVKSCGVYNVDWVSISGESLVGKCGSSKVVLGVYDDYKRVSKVFDAVINSVRNGGTFIDLEIFEK